MSGIYTAYISKDKYKSVQTESIYASWPKELNTWGKPPEKPPEKPPLPPPIINRKNKPVIYFLKEGYIETEF
jgi:hypothetical protein